LIHNFGQAEPKWKFFAVSVDFWSLAGHYTGHIYVILFTLRQERNATCE